MFAMEVDRAATKKFWWKHFYYHDYIRQHIAVNRVTNTKCKLILNE